MHLLFLFFRKAFSLTLSVNIVLIPVLLFHFHQFPFLSLFYNLFFPFLVGVALFLLLFSLKIDLLFPYLSSPLFFLTDWFTSELLTFASFPPAALNYSLRISHFPFWVIPPYLFLLLSLSFKYKQLTNWPLMR